MASGAASNNRTRVPDSGIMGAAQAPIPAGSSRPQETLRGAFLDLPQSL